MEVARKLHWIFISGLTMKTKAQDIIEFLKSQQINGDFVCEKMTTKSKQASSFKLGAPKELVEKVMDPQLWPEGIRINHFRNLQRRQTNKSSLPKGRAR